MAIITAILTNLLWVIMVRKERLSYESCINRLNNEVLEANSKFRAAKGNLSKTQCQLLKELGYKLYDIDHACLSNEPTALVYMIHPLTENISENRLGISVVCFRLGEKSIYSKCYPNILAADKDLNGLIIGG